MINFYTILLEVGNLDFIVYSLFFLISLVVIVFISGLVMVFSSTKYDESNEKEIKKAKAKKTTGLILLLTSGTFLLLTCALCS